MSHLGFCLHYPAPLVTRYDDSVTIVMTNVTSIKSYITALSAETQHTSKMVDRHLINT